MAAKNRGLGKGLDALFAENATPEGTSTVTLSISEIEPNRGQPRKKFDDKALAELADSIRQHGLITPVLVRPMRSGGYQLVAGERRWRAARMAGLNEIPVLIKELTDAQAMELALIENLQREDLNPIEEAEGYRVLMDSYGQTQDQVAERVNKSRPAVANAVRLLHLPEDVRRMVGEGSLSSGHARALLAFEDVQRIRELAKEIVKRDMTVREVERIAKADKRQSESGDRANKQASALRDSYFGEMELALHAELGRKVKITENGGEKGVIELAFFSKQDLADIASRLAGKDQ
ncbi:MAG: ParB/RepB/Spo0J family partition protein [Acetanaerobacterium sp.]